MLYVYHLKGYHLFRNEQKQSSGSLSRMVCFDHTDSGLPDSGPDSGPDHPNDWIQYVSVNLWLDFVLI